MAPAGLLQTHSPSRWALAKSLSKLNDGFYWADVHNHRYMIVFHALFEGSIDDSYPITVPKLSDVVKHLTSGPGTTIFAEGVEWKADVYDLNTGKPVKWERESKIRLIKEEDDATPNVDEDEE